MMAAPPRKRRLPTEQRRALQLLASLPFGATTEAAMFANGFPRKMLVRLIRAGLATAKHNTVKITDAGRRALEG
jgi:hypothetical protein